MDEKRKGIIKKKSFPDSGKRASQKLFADNLSWCEPIKKLGISRGYYCLLIGDLHDGVIRLQLPESFTFAVSYVNKGNCYLNPTGNIKI